MWEGLLRSLQISNYTVAKASGWSAILGQLKNLSSHSTIVITVTVMECHCCWNTTCKAPVSQFEVAIDAYLHVTGLDIWIDSTIVHVVCLIFLWMSWNFLCIWNEEFPEFTETVQWLFGSRSISCDLQYFSVQPKPIIILGLKVYFQLWEHLCNQV